ncbi:MAG: TM2 domain-containing protein [Phycisphaeraceae bacterium]
MSTEHLTPADADGDPLLGTQETTDSPMEARLAPEHEMHLEMPPVDTPVKSWRVASVLALLLGWAGCHRFYLGFVRIGLAQLALTVGSFTLALAIGLAAGASAMSALAAGIGVAALGLFWGLFEAAAIMLGPLNRDAHNRPLKHLPLATRTPIPW